MLTARAVKPLGRKAYGSIGHLPGSRTGPRDRHVPEGQAKICTEKVRDRHDRVICQEKLDGSCCAVALVDGEILPLVRAGYLAKSSPRKMHHFFHEWVMDRETRFRKVLLEGEWLVGEWLAQAHGTIYRLRGRDPFAVFDLFSGGERVVFDELVARVIEVFDQPYTVSLASPIPVDTAIDEVNRINHHNAVGRCEGVVYRVESQGRVEFLAKFVEQGKTDGRYLPEAAGCLPVWNWHPESEAEKHHVSND